MAAPSPVSRLPRISDAIYAAVLFAIIFMLVRPGSPSADVVKALTTASAALVGAVTTNYQSTKR